MNRYDDYNNSFSSLTSSVGVAPESITTWNIGPRHDQCQACTCCSRCGKKRLTEKTSSCAKFHGANQALILPLSSSILNRSTAKLIGHEQR